jgi:tRNA pseudouridine(55) synthase
MYTTSKKIGETPLEALQRFRKDNGIDKSVRLSYAGRLDPMASGKLLILEGEENDRRQEFLDLDKTYEFSILFGASTDTFDLLGLVDDIQEDVSITKDAVQKVLHNMVGEWQMTYPPYSAKTVTYKGEKVQLWKLARSGRLEEVSLPKRSVYVYEASCADLEKIDDNYIINYIINYITNVSGDFRQEKIIERWKEVLLGKEIQLPLAHCRVSGSSGLYVRRLAYEIGRELKLPSLAFSIQRTDVGDK